MLATYASVQFTYITRPDISTTYTAGYVTKLQHTATNIKTYLGATLVKDYQLSYTNNGAYHTNASAVADGSVLTQIKECDGSSPQVCKQPISLGWQLGTTTAGTLTTAQQWSGIAANMAIDAVVASGDINGDGKDDILYSGYPTPATISTPVHNLYYALSTGSGFVVGINTGLSSGKYVQNGTDANGAPVYQFQLNRFLLADMNGDGKADLISKQLTPYVNPSNPGTYYFAVQLSNGSGFGAAQNWLTLGTLADNNAVYAYLLSAGDVNGDGLQDVFYQNGSGSQFIIAFSTGSNFNAVNSGVTLTNTNNLVLIDVNGDGLADLLSHGNNYGTTSQSYPLVYISNGSGFGTQQNWVPSTGDWWPHILGSSKILGVKDYNGDGLQDVMYGLMTLDAAGNSVVGNYIAFSTGAQFTSGYLANPVTTYQAGTPNSAIPELNAVAGDFNGDGLGDVAMSKWIYPTGYYSQVNISQPNLPDQINSISNGLGATQTITYKRISDVATYTADTNSVYPVFDVPSSYPYYVVSSVASSDGLGGTITDTYSYGGLKVHLTGWGALGFRWMKQSTADADTYVSSFYRQDYPYIGLPSQVEKHLISNSGLLSVDAKTYANQPVTTGSAISQFPYMSQDVVQNYELDGSLVSTNTTTYQYDGYGNISQLKLDDGAGDTKTTVNTYNNDVARWLLGRLLRSNVTAVNATALPTLPTPQQVWTTCAGEYGTCSFVGTYTVRYGAPGQYITGTYTNGLDCNNGTFGSDPAPGITKSCDVLNLAPSQPVWTYCAGEGGTCTFTGTYPVRYGANGVYNTGTYTNSVTCNNGTFGDPAPGLGKSCEILK